MCLGGVIFVAYVLGIPASHRPLVDSCLLPPAVLRSACNKTLIIIITIQNHRHDIWSGRSLPVFNSTSNFGNHSGSTMAQQIAHARPRIDEDTSPLSRVLKIDTNARTAMVEPNLPMGRLVRINIENAAWFHLWLWDSPEPPLKAASQEQGGESSSFK